MATSSKAPAQGGLRIRKLADRSAGPRYNTFTGEPEPWPLAGIAIEGETPVKCTVSTRFVAAGRAEGWIDVAGENVVVRPGGPPEDPYRVNHVFIQLDAVILKTADVDLRYRVTHQPDKYAVNGDDDTPVTDELYAAGETRVDNFYVLELEA